MGVANDTAEAAAAPLSLVLEFARATQTAEPFAFRFLAQDYLLRSEGGGFESAHLTWDDALLADLQAMRRPDGDPLVLARLGERLRQFVTPLGWPGIADTLLRECDRGRTVILTVRSAAAELYALPWELLTCKASGQPIGSLPRLILRYEWPETQTVAEKPLPRAGCGRILLAWSAAGGAVPASEHIDAIRQACGSGAVAFDSEADVLPRASLGRLADALAQARRQKQPVSILHILCHGGEVGGSFGLLLDGPPGQADACAIDAGRLQQILAPYADMIRLVVLMACDGGNPGRIGNELGSVAQTLHRAGIAAVVASRYPLAVRASIDVTRVLYRELICGLRSLEGALLQARHELLRDSSHHDWAALQLYARQSDGDDTRPLVFRPYPGLDPFGREQERFYFGREALVAKLWQRCQDLLLRPGSVRLLAILAPSGFGKSSLARAGLAAEIERRPLRHSPEQPAETPTGITIFKPGPQPLLALTAALPSALTDDTAKDLPSAPRLLIVDQFEEIYTLCSDALVRDAFVDRLLSLASAPQPAVLVLLSLRTDFLGETGRQHPALNRLFGEQSELVTAMSEDALRRSIAAPAALLGRPLDTATVDLLLSQMQGSESALPLLSFALSQIWEGVLAQQQPADTLRELGGVGGALAGKAQAIYAALRPGEQATARRAWVRLVRLGDGTRDTRRRAPLGELCGHGETEEAVLAVLRHFAGEHARLISLSSDGTQVLAEVTHEALFQHWGELRTWIEQSRSDRGLYDRALAAASLWQRDGRPSGRLWRPPDLDLLRDYQRRKPEDLGHLVSEFLRVALRRRLVERALFAATLGGILAVLLVAFAIFYVEERRRGAVEQQRLLDPYVELGRRLLFDEKNASEAVLWLHRALSMGSHHPSLPYLLKSAMEPVDGTQAVLIGHRARIRAASFRSDGQQVLTAGDDKTARIWDAKTGQPLRVLQGHQGEILSAVFSADGRRVLTASLDRTAGIWDSETGQLITQLRGHSAGLEAAAFSPDGQRVVTASEDASARLWSAETGQPIVALTGHPGVVRHALFSPNGQRIVTVSTDATARLWDASSGQLLHELTGHGGQILHARFSRDGRRLVTSSVDNTARVWDVETGRRLVETGKSGENVVSADLSPDGQRLVTASLNGTAEIWSAQDGASLAKLVGHSEGLSEARFTPDGHTIVTASYDGSLRLWDADSAMLNHELRGHGAGVTLATFSPDAQLVLSASLDHTVRLWRANGARSLRVIRAHSQLIRSMALRSDGRRVVTASADRTARIWDVDSGQRLCELAGHQDSLSHVLFSSDGHRVATASADQTVRIWDADSCQLRAELKGHSDDVLSIDFSPDGQILGSASVDRSARIWNAQSGQLLTVLSGHREAVNVVRFSPDGQRVATGSRDATVRIWDARSGRMLREMKRHRGIVNDLAFSPDGEIGVSAGEDRELHIWDGRSGDPLADADSLLGSIWSVTFSPRDRSFVAVGFKNTARVWSRNLALVIELKGHDATLHSARYSRDGLHLATTSEDGTVRMWDPQSGHMLAVLHGRTQPSVAAEFSPDGRRLISAGAEGSIRVWDVASESRSAYELGRLIRCHVPLEFEGNSNAVSPRQPAPQICQSPQPPASTP